MAAVDEADGGATASPVLRRPPTVEAKLNELLDRDGGISKKKDAVRGYLKLLFFTAAAGDVGECTSQSTRDLSLILDAILKTKSRKVLVDVVNRNGLQMLHNIIKQNRCNFDRVPIIRKLLKVLEFLAVTGILTPELIKKDPPCSEMESFKESILKLASHSDKQVHKMAREFRDKWIPRSIRRVEPHDRVEGQFNRQLQCHHVLRPRGSDAIVVSAGDLLPTSAEETLSQFRHVPISSYGIQIALMQQLGATETGGNDYAPGVSFDPYPPLPTYPRPEPKPREERREIPTSPGREQLNIAQTRHWKSASEGRRDIGSRPGREPLDVVRPGNRKSAFDGRREIRSSSLREQLDAVQARHRSSVFDGRLKWPKDGCGKRLSESSSLAGHARRGFRRGFV